MAALQTAPKAAPLVAKSPDAERPVATASTASASAIPSVSASASAAASATAVIPDGVDAKKEALKLLERNKFKEAIAMSEAAIAQDPSDALGYLYLGTALQSSGKWADGIAAYSRCVHTATKGPVHECRQSGGR